MLAIPVPFVVSLVLAVLAGVVLARDGLSAVRRPGFLFLVAALLQTSIVGLRWTTDWPAARLIQPVMASLIPVLALWTVADLGARPWGIRRVAALAALVLAALVPSILMRLPVVDIILVGLFLGAGAWILVIALRRPDGFDGARLGEAGRARAASLTLAGLLIGGGAVDLALATDLMQARADAALLVSIGNLVTLAAAAGATIVLAAARPVPEVDLADLEAGGDARAPVAADIATDDPAILADVTHALDRLGLWRDADLTLAHLARKSGWPARVISAAINRHHGMNVSQFVNLRRIAAAQRLLAETDLPVTAVQFEAGFQTKSNFNRAFREVTGSSPSQWRAQAGDVRVG